MKYLLLLLRMLRYRVAIMLIVFFLLGCTSHNALPTITYSFVLAIVALLASYITATSLNDIADKDIDAINHPKNKGRPLVTGEANTSDLRIVYVIGLSVSLVTAAFISITGLVIIIISLVINYIYSVSPFRLSYRTFFAPLILSIAYVAIPYFLGLVVTQERFQQFDLLFLASLLALFCGRIILKDFRDRKGDAAYGKPTLVLRYGKKVTCILSVVFIIIGNILVLFSLKNTLFISLFFMVLFFTIYYAEYKLWKVNSTHTEQVMIGIGAKMGNGLLLLMLGLFIIQAYHGSYSYQIIFASLVIVMYISSFIALLSNPNKAIIGYKG